MPHFKCKSEDNNVLFIKGDCHNLNKMICITQWVGFLNNKNVDEHWYVTNIPNLIQWQMYPINDYHNDRG